MEKLINSGQQKVEKTTDELYNELTTLKEENIGQWLQEREEQTITFGQYLEQLCQKYKLSPSKVGEEAGISKQHISNTKNGIKTLSRNNVVKIGVNLGATKEEIDKLLKCAGHKELYPKRNWDCIVLYGLHHKLSVDEIDELLFDNGEDDLLHAKK